MELAVAAGLHDHYHKWHRQVKRLCVGLSTASAVERRMLRRTAVAHAYIAALQLVVD